MKVSFFFFFSEKEKKLGTYVIDACYSNGQLLVFLNKIKSDKKILCQISLLCEVASAAISERRKASVRYFDLSKSIWFHTRRIELELYIYHMYNKEKIINPESLIDFEKVVLKSLL